MNGKVAAVKTVLSFILIVVVLAWGIENRQVGAQSFKLGPRQERKASSPPASEPGKKAESEKSEPATPAAPGETPKEEPGKASGESAPPNTDMKQAGAELREPREEGPPGIKWADNNQEQRCLSMLAELRKEFLQARFYSIQGDACSTADHAKSFLKIVNDIQPQCPENFLEKKGYRPVILRNLNWLYKLGTDRCLQ